ncbi:MAG: [Fe-Fe] hydrogenase large subunit C-terminal domain-containing protein [Bacillota bacterium]
MKKHSVLLKEDKCEGCTNCVKNCPTKAIRVHNGKAQIREDLCIDCAECIRTCEYHAKYTQTDELKDLKNKKINCALIPPSFYGQFDKNIDIENIYYGLRKIGFDLVVDVALAAEAISQKTEKFLNQNEGSYISSSCPVVVRLVKLLYPELLDQLIPIKSPVELMAEKVKRTLTDKEKVKEEDINIFFITPCPAKLSTVNNPLAQDKSYLDGAIAVDMIYDKLIDILDDKDFNKNIEKNYNFENEKPYLGISWGQSGGEEEILNNYNENETISVSGIKNVKKILEEISRNNIKGIKYFELVACPEGCVGGILNVKNPYQAKYNIKKLVEKYKSQSKEKIMVEQDLSSYNFELDKKFKATDASKLAQDLDKAMEKLTALEKEIEILPGLDCAACGAPDCETLAEDIVNGEAKRTDCVFMLRKKVGDLADEMSSLAHELPPVMGEKKEAKKNNEG